MTTEHDVKDIVREKYGQAAQRVAAGQANGCCGASALEGCDPITSDLYDSVQAGEVPEKCRRRPCRRRLVAATRPPWRS